MIKTCVCVLLLLCIFLASPVYASDDWTQKIISGPSARDRHILAYIGGDQALLFGGYTGSYSDETWVYDLSNNTWSQKSLSTKPSARIHHAGAYIGSDKAVIFGGYDGGYDNETWVYDQSDNTWSQKSPSLKPSTRYGQDMAYIGGDQVLLFGGSTGFHSDETWVYDLSNNTWTQDANSTEPSNRHSHGLSETSMTGSSYLVLFGGYDYPSGYNNETWTFGGGDYSLPVLLSSFTAVDQNGNVVLQWVTESETNNLGFILERQSGTTDWNTIASYETHDALKSPGNTSNQTEYEFVDTDVLPDETYTYRLSDVNTDGIITVDDIISITLDKLPEITQLKPAFPNPFNPRTKISYTLSKDANVTLKVINTMGQTIQTIIQGQNQSTGSYSIHWNGKTDTGIDASSGTYLLVLKAGTIRKTQKVMLIR